MFQAGRENQKILAYVSIVYKVFESTEKSVDSDMLNWVLRKIQNCENLKIAEDEIIEFLFKSGKFEMAKHLMQEFLLYKMQKGEFGATYMNCTQSVEEYIDGNDWRIKANANTGYSSAGLVNNLAGKVIANYWLDCVYSKEEGLAHREGDLHIHDLDCLSGYCAGWSLRVLLNEGFNGVNGRVDSKAPKHFREALGQMANFLGILQSEWAGAQAFSSFDTYLAPYVFRDKLSYIEVKKAIRSFVYNLNVPARWGQSPFTNITIDWSVPQDLKNQIPTRNDMHLFANLVDKDLLDEAQNRGVKRLEDLTYGHFLNEMRIINRAFYEVMSEGDKNGAPFTFPIPTVNITEDFDWDDLNCEFLFENTAKIGSSYFQNFIGSQYTQDEYGNRILNEEAYKPNAVRSMCCRLQLDLRELLKRGGGLFGSAEMTGSIGVVTINMARLGYRFCGNKEALKEELFKLMDLAFSTLEKKRKVINQLFNQGLYPYTKRYLPSFNHHFSTIGVNGMHEMMRNFTQDQYGIESEEGEKFCLEILEAMRQRIKEYQEKSGNLYNLEATPAEGTTYRFAKEDKKRFGDKIIQAGNGENVYYTNSSQLPVNFSSDPFFVLQKQDKLQCKYTGGTVLHLYVGERIENAKVCKELIKKIITQYALPYITITPIFSICPTHGYISGEHSYCPKCAPKQTQCTIYTRVMGYHRPISSFNIGKLGEHQERVFFDAKIEA